MGDGNQLLGRRPWRQGVSAEVDRVGRRAPREHVERVRTDRDPSQSGYNASKFAVRGFTEALRQELLAAGHPVGVSCVHPGGVKTEIARNARTDRPDADELARSFERIARTSPEQAARTILDGVRAGRGQILVGTDARLLDAGQRLLGPSYQQISYRLSKLLDR